ncbi:hypothetical protein DV737_g3496, partial [Chaetothyriales sp. CBS 132003]
MAEQKYYIKEAIKKPAVHHESYQALWETKWKPLATLGVYPFMFGTIKDFEPVVQEIIKAGLKEPYDWDELAQKFFPKAEELAQIAAEAEKAGEKEKASEYYLRSSAVYRIARFPAPRSEKQKYAWKAGKEVFYKGAALQEHAISEVLIPHKHKIDGEGDVVPVNLLLPADASASNPRPLVLIITGLDGYRTELAVWQQGFRQKGVGTLIAEIPGTGDSPALAQDPTAPDRQWASVLDWVGEQKGIDASKVIVWGFSTGGYYALRVAHTEKDRVLSAISLGGGAHHMFDREWLENVNKLEYPFDLANTLAYKWGYSDLESFIEAAPKYSLLNDGTLQKPCTKVLLVNGTADEIFPIDDLFVALENGQPKEARMVKGKKHMGEPESFGIILKYIYGLLGIEGNVVDQLKLLPFKPNHAVPDANSVLVGRVPAADTAPAWLDQAHDQHTHLLHPTAIYKIQAYAKLGGSARYRQCLSKAFYLGAWTVHHFPETYRRQLLSLARCRSHSHLPDCRACHSAIHASTISAYPADQLITAYQFFAVVNIHLGISGSGGRRLTGLGGSLLPQLWMHLVQLWMHLVQLWMHLVQLELVREKEEEQEQESGDPWRFVRTVPEESPKDNTEQGKAKSRLLDRLWENALRYNPRALCRDCRRQLLQRSTADLPHPPEPVPQPQQSGDAKQAAAGGSSPSGSSPSGSSPSGPSAGDSAPASSPASGSSGAGDGSRGRGRPRTTQISKPTVPQTYPQIMAIPIAKRPLFPGFYKAVTIKDANVVAAIHEMIKRGQPYVGAFLFKDEAADKDIIEKADDVHDVGVFAQITSAFPVHGDEHSVTAVLYPHRRIKMNSLIPATRSESRVATAQVQPVPEDQAKADAVPDSKGDVVASFEENSKDDKAAVAVYEPTAFLRKYAVSLVNVENIAETQHDKKSGVIRALTSEIVNVLKEIASLNPLFRDQISDFSVSQSAGNVIEEPAKLADFAAAVSAGEIDELQDVLQEMDVEQRLHKALTTLKKELMNAKLQSKISKDVESKIQKRQREYWLMEQMKGIRRELGIESDGKDKLVEKFKEKAAKLAMPEAVKKVFEEELNKLAHLEPAASEFNVTRNYLDWITQIPWGQRSAENFAIKNAMTVLDEDHYGLKDVKDRILEFIAVGKLRGTVEGKILCFVGPPGVGKTSIGKSIARALNRQYYRFSVGGLTDVAEIKGHRRTYVGALPGRVIQALKKCQTENPLILIDEVDKIGRGHQGDPASALLELLDPEQNSSFLDHYMDVPVDLSKVLFVCTANMTDTIPRPLLDRMEVIELSGYVADEKKAIADRYLAPQAKELAGLKEVDVHLDASAIEELINKYCRESGVRNLKKQIEKVYRKSALKIVQDLGDDVLPEPEALPAEGKAAQVVESDKDETDVKETLPPPAIDKDGTEEARKPLQMQVPDTVHVNISKDNLKDYVGPPVFISDRLYESTPPGVAMGLAWTSMGGAALYVESILESALSHSSRPGLERTGNLKAVMKESIIIAYSFAKSVLATRFPENKFFDHARIHLHCPEGAVQKDGPSAGITMATSLLSLAMNKEVDPKLAMTGELTVTGKVLRIGGLREKTVAARRAGCTRILFPKDNLGDWEELPENIKEGIQGHAVDWYSDVFDLVFPDLDHQVASSLWKKDLQEPSKKKTGKREKDDKKKKDDESGDEESGDDD